MPAYNNPTQNRWTKMRAKRHARDFGGGMYTPARDSLPASYMNEFGTTATSGEPSKKIVAAEAAIGKKSAGKTETKILAYPENVATDIQQGHYIIFEIMQQTKAKLAENKAIKKGKAWAAGGGGGHPSETARAAGMRQKMANIAADTTKSFDRALDASTKSGGDSIAVKMQSTEKLATCIALYMPASVKVQYGMDYNETEISALAETAGGAIQAAMGADGIMSGLGAALGTATKGGGAVGMELAMKGITAASPGSAALIALGRGKIITPKMELMFTGVKRRTFSYDFLFIPKSASEAAKVEEIVHMFKYHMASSFSSTELPLGMDTGGVSGTREMTIPDHFNIKYMYAAGENTHINKIKTCILNQMDVDYGGDKYVTYPNGQPQTTKISLSFQELYTVTKEDIVQGNSL